MRRVHAYCLYCGEEYEDERMLSTRCGPQHIRNTQKISDEEFDEILAKNKELLKNPKPAEEEDGENQNADENVNADANPEEKPAEGEEE